MEEALKVPTEKPTLAPEPPQKDQGRAVFTSNFTPIGPIQNEDSDPNILHPGDIISVPVSGITGQVLPGLFYHTGVYIGDGKVISKYLIAKDSSLVGQGKIALENINSKNWKGWVRIKTGTEEAANKARIRFHAYQNDKVQEHYHLKSDNCQTFTEFCLAEGIGSLLYSNL